MQNNAAIVWLRIEKNKLLIVDLDVYLFNLLKINPISLNPLPYFPF